MQAGKHERKKDGLPNAKARVSKNIIGPTDKNCMAAMRRPNKGSKPTQLLAGKRGGGEPPPPPRAGQEPPTDQTTTKKEDKEKTMKRIKPKKKPKSQPKWNQVLTRMAL